MLITLASLQEADKCIKLIAPGTYEIKWFFDCKLLPGIYYFDSSVSGIIKEDREVLCRIKDITVFKVQNNEQNHYQGLVNLNQTINVTKIV